MIRRFIEYKLTITRILASRAGTLNLVLSNDVARPAHKPAPRAASVARNGFTPFMISTATTAAPRTKLPSTVRSGKASTRKVRYTPKARNPYTSPSYREKLSKRPTVARSPS